MMSYKKGSTTTSYKYNWDSIRTTKTVGNTTTKYFLDGSTILAQQTGSNTMPFYYDANGKRVAFKYNGEMYFYVYNLQGDVTHIMKDDKTIVGTYTYDAWGKITNLNSLTAIAQVNPFRYRGYYYDSESNLYYLNSRYYNPEWGRFINADGFIVASSSLKDRNLYAYACCNPIVNIDPTGMNTFSIFLDINLTCIIGASIGIGVSKDDNGTVAFQWDYSSPTDMDTLTVGVVDIGISVQFMSTTLDTVNDLCGSSMSLGCAYGNGIYGSFDVIVLPNQPKLEMVGTKVGIGFGGGADVFHFSQTDTKNINCNGNKNKTINKKNTTNNGNCSILTDIGRFGNRVSNVLNKIF